MKPKWKHDCTKCRYLGSMSMSRGFADWYECEGTDRSVVARFSEDGPDYWSMPKDMVTDDRYMLARSASDDTVGLSHMQILAQYMLKYRRHSL